MAAHHLRGVLRRVVLAEALVILPQVEDVHAARVAPLGNEAVGGEDIDGVDDHPQEEAGYQKFDEYPEVLPALVPDLV